MRALALTLVALAALGHSAARAAARNVGGIVVPHAVRVEDALGETALTLTVLRYDIPLADKVFRLQTPVAAAARPAS